MHAASRPSSRRRSRSGARTRTRLAQASSSVCRLGRITYPSGHKALYSRNATGQITGISTQAPAKGKAATRQFDAEGRLTANEFARYGYDPAGRITSISQDLWAQTVAQTTVVSGTGTATQTAAVTLPSGVTATTVTSSIVVRTSTVVSTPSALYTTPLNWSVQYDNNTNRLSALQKTIADSDLDGDYEAGAGTADVRTESQSAQLGAGFAKHGITLNAAAPADERVHLTTPHPAPTQIGRAVAQLQDVLDDLAHSLAHRQVAS